MKKVILITLLIFASFVSAAAQETAGAMPVRPALNDSTTTVKSAAPLLTEIYRVGVGDVLDIRLINSLRARRKFRLNSDPSVLSVVPNA
jgi:hypothetical protein